MKMILLCLLLFGFSQTGLAIQPVPFDKIQEFHQSRSESIKSNYGLGEKVDVSILISPKEMRTLNEFDEQQKIKLPGLLLGGIEVPRDPATIGIFEVIRDLENYKREITVIKKKRVSDEEVQALILSLKEHLSLRPDETVRIEDKTFNFQEEMQNWNADLKEAFYKGTFKNANWAWIPIVLLILSLLSFLFSWSLKSGLGSVGESIRDVDFGRDQELETAFQGGGVAGGASGGGADEGEFEEEVMVSSDSMFEADPLRMFQKLTSLYLKSKYELYKILWTYLKDQGLQVSFYEMFTQSLNEVEEKEFKTIFFEIFKMESGSLHNIRTVELSPEILSQISRSISLAEMTEPVIIRERALAAIYPKYAQSVSSIVENSVEKFFEVIFYLFPEKVISALKKNPELSKSVSSRLSSYLQKPLFERTPSSDSVQEFAVHVESHNGFLDAMDVEVDEHTMKLLKNLSDSEIFNSLNSDRFKNLKKVIPSVDWIVAKNLQILRRFLISLSVEEIGYIDREHHHFQGLLDELDERAVIRINEAIDRSYRSNKKVDIAALRNKIAKSFKPPQNNEETDTDDLFRAA